jgi:hypothetical protein
MVEGDHWKAEVFPPLRSAYKTACGIEPEFTNYAQTADQDEPFMDTLDYIFHSAEWDVLSADRLPTKQETILRGKSLPMANEPSDHLLIGATLQLKKQQHPIVAQAHAEAAAVAVFNVVEVSVQATVVELAPATPL